MRAPDPGARAGAQGEEAAAAAALLSDCYAEMRRIARKVISGDRLQGAIQATELAHEAAIRLLAVDRMDIRDKAHMLAMAARTMRRILIDEARRAGAAKRQTPSFITIWPDDPASSLIDIGDLDRAIEALEGVSPDHAQVVELRFMMGLTVDEAAAVSGIPARTLKRRWQAARAWLLDYLGGYASPQPA